MKRLDLVTLLAVAVLAAGCGASRRDGDAVRRLGGVWVLTGETWSTRRLPVVSVTFDAGGARAERRRLG